MQVVICSSDKDLMQLCDENVTVLDTMKNRRMGPAEVKEKFGVSPAQVGDVLALMGDSIDNVPGVDGIGPKTAAELIGKFGSLDGLYAHLDEVKGKRRETLATAREAVKISRELVALRDDVPLPKTVAELHRVEPDRDKLLAVFRELEFSRLIEALTPARPALTPPPWRAWESATGRARCSGRPPTRWTRAPGSTTRGPALRRRWWCARRRRPRA